MTQRPIELLAPAKNIECAREAILHGADAVYIGAPKFGARAAAGNSLEDLAALVEFAHRFYVRIYVTVNTLLYDDELPEVENLIWALWRIGVDALIVQDLGITRLNLPPIPLHASTQMDNRTPEKLRFLSQAGFRQIVLARELSLEQIKAVYRALPNKETRLEAFVHGALCVSYSGQCYMSQVLGGRSANRGVCAQYCRLPYDLYDADGRCLARQKYLLSLKDLQRSASDLEAMIDAGISSFKIEGRLKDVDYCKNVTAWYRGQLDDILARRPDLKRSSSGKERIDFQPDLSKSFNRSFTSYYLHGRGEKVSNPDTPKSMGEEMGFVRAQKLQHFIYLGKNPLHNGDGLSYFDENGNFDGFRVNRVEENRIFPANPRLRLKTGIKIYRTYNQEFCRQLEKPTARRFVPVTLECRELPDGFVLQMDDTEGHRAAVRFETERQKAEKSQQNRVKELLSKAANPVFQVEECRLQWSQEWFVPVSVWTQQRNALYEAFERVRRIQYPRREQVWEQTTHPYPLATKLDYRGNVLNQKAAEFYQMHGVVEIAPALESGQNSKPSEIELMRCKHCLRYALGACPKQPDAASLSEPLTLRYKDHSLRLKFDCARCEMVVLGD